jgi:hypothetical protein
VCKEGATGAPTQPPPHHRLRLAVALAIAAASSCLPSEPPPRLRLACPLACCLPGTRCRPWRFGPFHLLLVPFSGRRLICSCLVLPVAVWLHHLLDLVVSARRASGFTISLCFYSADLFPWWFLDFGLNLLHSARFSNIFSFFLLLHLNPTLLFFVSGGDLLLFAVKKCLSVPVWASVCFVSANRGCSRVFPCLVVSPFQMSSGATGAAEERSS